MTPLLLLSRLKLWRCAKVGARVEVLGSVFVVGGGRVEIGDDVVLDGREVPVELHAEPGALLIIGHGSVLESGVSVEAQQRVEVGPGCRLRAFAKLMDNNFHPVSGSRHQRPASQPVKLEAAVDVGERAIVLPGAWLEAKVTLGRGVVIARRVRAGMTVLVPKPYEPGGADQAADHHDQGQGERQAEVAAAEPPGDAAASGGLMKLVLLEVLDWLELKVPDFKRAQHTLARARSRIVLSGCIVGDNVLVHGELKLEARGKVSVGARCVFVGGPSPTALRVRRGGSLELGARCYFNYGATFEVNESVRVGANCMFGSYVKVSDAVGAPVVLGQDVWIAHGAVIHPGVHIGDGAVVSAGSVVMSDVPAGMVAIGNPARMMSKRLCTGGSHV